MWCSNNGIALIIAAPSHQEMNGINERNWQTCRQMAFSMCNGARLGFPYFHHALMYAARIMDVLPAKGCVLFRNGDWKQSTPGMIWNGTDGVNVKKFRVFGCPAVVKVRRRKTPPTSESTNQVNLNTKNIIQRGVRGIFVGFPDNQAGWSIFVPQSGRILVSVDVAFDEQFLSPGLCKWIYSDSRKSGAGFVGFRQPGGRFQHNG